MPTADETVAKIGSADSWDERVNRFRQIPQRHGTTEHKPIYAEIARQLYVPHLGPDYAYVHWPEFYEAATFQAAYESAFQRTEGFTSVSAPDLARSLIADPTILLPLRVLTGLTKNEFAETTKLVAEPLGLKPLSVGKVDSMERKGSKVDPDLALVASETIDQLMTGKMFGTPPGDLRSKQSKPDTAEGWLTVQEFATGGVPLGVFLHQRHYGGAFRQLLDATSVLRGDLIEDAVQALFEANGVPFIRTGSHNQAEIEERFEVEVRPAPDFVIFDGSDSLRAILECKGANDGGTARDKALRFERLRSEAIRLGGIPLFAVLGGLGWLRVNDTLGPVVRDCDGRVFSISNLDEMMTVSPLPSVAGTISATSS